MPAWAQASAQHCSSVWACPRHHRARASAGGRRQAAGGQGLCGLAWPRAERGKRPADGPGLPGPAGLDGAAQRPADPRLARPSDRRLGPTAHAPPRRCRPRQRLHGPNPGRTKAGQGCASGVGPAGQAWGPGRACRGGGCSAGEARQARRSRAWRPGGLGVGKPPGSPGPPKACRKPCPGQTPARPRLGPGVGQAWASEAQRGAAAGEPMENLSDVGAGACRASGPGTKGAGSGAGRLERRPQACPGGRPSLPCLGYGPGVGRPQAAGGRGMGKFSRPTPGPLEPRPAHSERRARCPSRLKREPPRRQPSSPFFPSLNLSSTLQP